MRRKNNPSGFPRKTFTGSSRTPPTLWSTSGPYQQENVPEGETPSPTPARSAGLGSIGVQGSTSGPSKKRKRGRPENNPPLSVYARATVGQLRPKATIRPVQVTLPVGEPQIPSPIVTPTMTMVASAPASTGLTGNYGDALEKKKRARGRQRKHAQLAGFSSVSPTSLGNPAPNPSPGDLLLLAATSTKFSTRMIYIQPGENVATKIFQCTKKGTREICIFSASGAVSDVKIWRSDGGMVTHKGCYDIISLSASLVSLTRGLYVTLLAGNGLVTIGGAVSDVLIAASPILIVIGTFKLKKPRKKKNREEDTATSTSSTQEDTATSSTEAISGP